MDSFYRQRRYQRVVWYIILKSTFRRDTKSILENHWALLEQLPYTFYHEEQIFTIRTEDVIVLC